MREEDAQFMVEFKAARVKYPQACTSCGGLGFHTTYSRDTPPDQNSCPKCIDQGRCPVCAEDSLKFIEGTDPKSGLSNDHFECPHCDYNELTAEPVLPDF